MRQLSQQLAGHPTEILVQSFTDCVLVLVTQLGRVGNLIQASIPDSAPLLPAPDNLQCPNQQFLPPPSPAIQLTPLLGSSPSEHMHTLHSLYTSQIATIVWTQATLNTPETTRRNVVVGLALKKSDGPGDEGLTKQEKELFQGVMSALRELLE